MAASVQLTLGGNFAKLDELKSKSMETANSIKTAFSGSMVGIAGAIAGFVSMGAAIAAVGESMKQVMEDGRTLQDSIFKTGASGKELVIIQNAFENAGSSGEDAIATIQKMQRALGGLNDLGEPTNKTFEKLGLQIDQLKQMDPAAAFWKVSSALQAVGNASERTKLVADIFGKGGPKALSVINDKNSQEDANKAAGRYGEILQKNAGVFDSVGDAMNNMNYKFKEVTSQLLVKLLPVIKQFQEYMLSVDSTKIVNGISHLVEVINRHKVALLALMAVQFKPFTEGLVTGFNSVGLAITRATVAYTALASAQRLKMGSQIASSVAGSGRIKLSMQEQGNLAIGVASLTTLSTAQKLSIGLKSVGAGIVGFGASIGRSLLAMVGGWPGLAVIGLAMAASAVWDLYHEAENRANRLLERAKQSTTYAADVSKKIEDLQEDRKSPEDIGSLTGREQALKELRKRKQDASSDYLKE